MAANATSQPLGDAANQGGSDQVGLNAHFEQASHRADAVVGVERGKNQVPGLRGADGNFGGFKITNFTDQNDIGVMPQDGAQARGESEADLFAHLDLHRAFELIFDRDLRR